MKILKYKYVKSAALLTSLAAVCEVLMSYSLSLLVVNKVNLLVKNIVIVGIIYLAQSIFLFLRLRVGAQASIHIQQVLNQNIDKYFAHMSFQKFHEKDHGERLSMYINDVPKVVELTIDKFISQVSMGTMAIASFVALVYIHFSMGILAVISFIIMAGLPRLFQKKLSAYISGLQGKKAGYTSKMRELLQGFTTFFENRAFPVFFRKSFNASKKYTAYQLHTETFTAVMSAVLTLANGLISVISVAIVAYYVIIGQVNAGSLLAVVALVPNFGSSVTQLLTEHEFYKSGLALFEEKFSFAKNDYRLQTPQKELLEESVAIQETNQLQSRATSLRLEGVTVNYTEPLALPDLEFKEGKKYAVTGESGCGKSSLLKVIIGEIENYSGKVFAGSALKSPKKNLFDIVSYVNQETFLFNDTVKNNIDFSGTMSVRDVESLLKKVGLDSISYDQIIEDNGRNLSGGQRQRLAFARALARGKRILILDEATANLDKQTALKIENLAMESTGMVIMITHHMSEELKHRLDNVIELRSIHGSSISTR